jgi:iron complex transport system substrate-binding protein
MLETSGKHSTVSKLLGFAGMKNVCEMKEEHVSVNIEKLYEWNPEFIIMWYNERLDPEDIIKNYQFAGIAAVKNKKVFELPEIFQCDFWTLKFVYPAYLMNNWGSDAEVNKTQDSLFLNDMFYDLYGKNLL